MPPSGFDPRSNARLEAYVRGLAGGAGLSQVIHPSDEMYLYNLRSLKGCDEAAAILYYLKGWQIFRTVEEIVQWRFGGFSGVDSFLDFASGFGRFTRFLVRGLPAARVTISEIDPVAVRFQEDAFGVRGIVSATDPADFTSRGAFDVVLASSFFSHLPPVAFETWVGQLYRRVAPSGLFVFSVHGPRLLTDPAADWSDGIVFRPESETTRLDPAGYGTAYVTEEFVRETAARATGGEGALFGFPFGFCAHQDLYVLLRPPAPALPRPKIRLFPRGELDLFEIRGETVLLEGWVALEESESALDVRLLVRDSCIAACPIGPGAGTGRWSFTFALPQAAPDDVVRVEAESRPGFTNILAMGTLRPFLPDSAGRADG